MLGKLAGTLSDVSLPNGDTSLFGQINDVASPFDDASGYPIRRPTICHVLIIEDEVLIAMDIQGLLEDHGALSFAFAVEEAEVVLLAREARPDVIVSDVSLLEGTGPQAVAIIRSEHGPLPVLFITATPHLCVSFSGPTRVFPKPLDRLLVAAAFREMAFA